MSELHVKLGELLAIERKRQNRSLDELSASLKISETNLKLLESGDPSGMPSSLYFELFAKSYAEELGIDYEATVLAIKDEIGCFPEEVQDTKGRSGGAKKPTPEKAEPAAPDHGSAFKKVAYVIGAVVVLLVVFLVINRLYLSDSDDATDPHGAINDESSETAVADARNEPDAGLDRYEWKMPAYEEPGEITLALTARRESWAAVVADGDTAFFRTLQIGQVRTVTAKYRLQVSIGVPSGIDVELNGQLVDLRNERGRIHQVEITQLNLPDILAGVTPNEVPNSSVTVRPEENAEEPAEETAARAPGGATDEEQPVGD